MSTYDDEVTACPECGTLNKRSVNPCNCWSCGAELPDHRYKMV